MKQKKSFFIIIMFIILFVYTTNIDKIPSEIVLFQNQDYEISYMKGINLEGENVSVADTFFRNFAKISGNYVGDEKITLSVFGGAIKKDINVSVLPKTNVILGGDTVGIRLYSEGVLVIGEMPVQGMDGNYYEPYSATKIEKGDIITKINDVPVETIEELTELVNNSDEEKISIEYKKDDTVIKEEMVPVKAFGDNLKKLGLWVKDGVMGVGTLTFYDPENKMYAALGHGISDTEVKELINVDTGKINVASILDVTKGAKDAPGEIKGLLNDDIQIGTIEKNNLSGIFGEFTDNSNYFRGRKSVEIAAKNEVKLGKAKVICTVDGDNYPKEYDIEILKIATDSNSYSRGMTIKVTDSQLLEKTGGIIQGMSGSPIIQEGKLIGAVTHVYVKDPTKGYAIFAETMLKEMD
ncbi:MAG: SpoIVB peptidase [Clostridia bacterium]|nr:SpoIVB peptidase [Clostridia bacterium]